MKNILVLLFFSIPLMNIFSQDQRAELIFDDGETLEGFGMITKNDKIKFRISLDDEPDKWDFLIVKGIIFYGFNTSKEFEYVKINKKQKPVLLEIISRGKVTLYNNSQTFYSPTIFFGNNNFMNYNLPTKSNTLYVKRENEEIAINLAGRFKKKSIEYFKDCSEILDIFSTREYLKYSIINIVDEYNIYCSGE